MSDLYDDIMMDHIKNARNYRNLSDPTGHAEGINPLCGDRFSLFVRLDRDIISDLGFQCECCGISMASASMMTELLKGKTKSEADLAIEEFKQFITGTTEQFKYGGDLHAVFKTLAKFPSRVNCASLGWTTLGAALNGKTEVTV